MKKRVYPALCLLLALLTACAPPQADALRAGTVCRRPQAVTASLADDPNVDAGWGDFRCADLRSWDLTDMETELFSADFDTRGRTVCRRLSPPGGFWSWGRTRDWGFGRSMSRG